MTRWRWDSWASWVVILGLGGPLLPAAEPVPDEEFVGPFRSWRDLKRDYQAVGDGKADDTGAVQRALDDLVKHEKACVLYVPSGEYRLTGTVRTARKGHTDCQGVAVVGEDPARTVLRWDGPKGGTMVQWDAWYSKFSRLTLDGAGKAGTALLYGPAFSTYNETSDLVIRDANNGVVFGSPDSQGQAENEVLRCHFVRCQTGVMTVNWNSMDIWVWYCGFEDCDRGVFSVMGNWHAWQCDFRRSKVADVGTQNLMAFSVVNNTSVGAKRFLDFSSGHTWGSPTSLTGNRVIDPSGDWAVVLDNAGPYLLVDNVFRLSGPAGAVRMTWADQTLVGNTYTRPEALEVRGRFRRIGEKVVAAEAVSRELPKLPPAPARRERPVVHLPMGKYKVERTLVVPAGCDVQLVGDGAGETATRLEWSGPPDGVMLHLKGPSRATLRDLYVLANGARAVLVDGADQEGGRVFADQLNVNGPQDQKAGRTAAIRVQGLDRTDVLLRALQGSGNGGAWVDVAGGPGAVQARNQVSVLTGATGSAAGQYDVRGGGRLVVRGVYHERSSGALEGLRLADRGTLSIDATRFSYATSAESPTVAVDGFRGRFTLATCMLLPLDTKVPCRFEMRGDGSGASVLALNNQFWLNAPAKAEDIWLNLAKPRAAGGLIGCNVNTSNKEAAPKGFAFLDNRGDHPDPAKSKFGAGPLEDRGGVDDAAILRHLAPLRETRVWLPTVAPAGVTDLRLHRVMASGGRGAVVEFRADP